MPLCLWIQSVLRIIIPTLERFFHFKHSALHLGLSRVLHHSCHKYCSVRISAYQTLNFLSEPSLCVCNSFEIHSVNLLLIHAIPSQASLGEVSFSTMMVQCSGRRFRALQRCQIVTKMAKILWCFRIMKSSKWMNEWILSKNCSTSEVSSLWEAWAWGWHCQHRHGGRGWGLLEKYVACYIACVSLGGWWLAIHETLKIYLGN